MDGNEPPGKRIIQVQPSNVNKIEGIIPPTTGKNDNAINQQLILNNNKPNVKFFPYKTATTNVNKIEGIIPPTTGKNDNAIDQQLILNNNKPNVKFFPYKSATAVAKRKTQIEQSFREVEITFSNHVKDGAVVREAKVNDTIAALCEVKEVNVERKQEKEKNDKKGRKMKTRAMSYDDTKKKHNIDGQVDSKAGSESMVNVVTDGKEKKKTIKPKEKHDEDGQVNDKAGSDSHVKAGTDGKGIKKASKPKEKHYADGQVNDKAGVDSNMNAGTDGKEIKKASKPKKKQDADGQEVDKASADSKVNIGTDGKGKKKETKTKEKKKSKKNMTKVKEEVIKEEPADTEEKMDEVATGNANNRRKLPCVFGFIATWLAKRKEKRRDKKRKAIAARASPVQRLVEYEHKSTRGGEAFTIEVDNRPSFAKPLLPPIKQTPGPIRRERYQNAVCRRAENLAQRKYAAREFEKKKVKYKDKRAQSDYQLRQKAHVGIRQKQANAEWNRDIISRSKSRLRAPSAMQPSEYSDKSFNEPSAESSFGSIHGPSCFSENEDDRGVWIVDKVVDIPIF